MTTTPANILVIEDHAVVQLGISTLLSTCSGIDVIDRAANGADAIGKFVKGDFSIVLIDVELPDMSGFELLKRIRTYRPSVRVLFYSMHDELWVVRQMFNSEADGRITQETVGNSMAHAKATQVHVNLTRQRDDLCLVVEDNGQWKETEAQAAQGIGRQSLDERARSIDASIDTRHDTTSTTIQVNVRL